MSFRNLKSQKNKGYGATVTRINRDPLRAEIGETYIAISKSMPPLRHLVLECGHAILPPTDMVGEYKAQRRRCYYCGKK